MARLGLVRVVWLGLERVESRSRVGSDWPVRLVWRG